MTIENINSSSIDNHKQELEIALKDIRESAKDLKEDIKEIDKDQLQKIIDKNLKNSNGNRKNYKDMLKSPGYNFIVQATIDLLGEKDASLDKELKSSGNIDMIYGRVTRKLVIKIQSALGIKPDGRAGKDFFSAALECLNGKRGRKIIENKGPENKNSTKLDGGNNSIDRDVNTPGPSLGSVRIKLNNFMSPMSTGVSSIDLSIYHFDTVNWGPNMKPNPELVVKEIEALGDWHSDEMLGYLKSNPAKVKELQRYINDHIYNDHIDIDVLNRLLSGTGMELGSVPGRPASFIGIREDGMLGPQTYAALCCFRDGCYPSGVRP